MGSLSFSLLADEELNLGITRLRNPEPFKLTKVVRKWGRQFDDGHLKGLEESLLIVKQICAPLLLLTRCLLRFLNKTENSMSAFYNWLPDIIKYAYCIFQWILPERLKNSRFHNFECDVNAELPLYHEFQIW